MCKRRKGRPDIMFNIHNNKTNSIPFDFLPMGVLKDDPEVSECHQLLWNLSEQKIVNLTGLSRLHCGMQSFCNLHKTFYFLRLSVFPVNIGENGIGGADVRFCGN